MVQLVEHDSQDLLHWEQCLHHMADDAGVRSDEGEGVCLEASHVVAGRKSCQCADCVLDIQEVAGHRSQSGKIPK